MVLRNPAVGGIVTRVTPKRYDWSSQISLTSSQSSKLPRNIIVKIKPLKQYTQLYGKPGTYSIALHYTIRTKLCLCQLPHWRRAQFLQRRNLKLQTENFSVCIAYLNIFPNHFKILFKFTQAHSSVSVLAPPHMQDPNSQGTSSIASLIFQPPSLSQSTHVSNARQSYAEPEDQDHDLHGISLSRQSDLARL